MLHGTTQAAFVHSNMTQPKPFLSVITFPVTPAPYIPANAISNKSHVKSARNFSGAMFRHNYQPVHPPTAVSNSNIRQNSVNHTADMNQTNPHMKMLNICKRVATYFHRDTSQWDGGICCHPNRQRTISRSLSMSNKILKERSKSASAAARKMQATHQSLVLEGKQQPMNEK